MRIKQQKSSENKGFLDSVVHGLDESIQTLYFSEIFLRGLSEKYVCGVALVYS